MPIPVSQEVRPGLFVLHFTQNDIEIGEHSFQLRKCDYYPYTFVFECPEGLQQPVMLSLIKSQSNKMKTLPVGSKYSDLARANQGSKYEDDQARYVWILYDGEQKPTHLKLQSCNDDVSHTKRMWGPVKCPLDKPFDLWLDFGTETPGEKTLLNQWARLLIQQDLTDVEFNVQGELMGAHAPIITASSSVLASLLSGRPTRGNRKSSKVVHISDVEPQVFQQLLHYMYSGRIPLIEEEGMAERLFKAAHKYGLESLKDECTRFVFADLDEHNVVDTLIWSYKNSLFSLYDSALNFSVQNYGRVSSQPDWQDLIDNHPQICLRVSQLMDPLVSNTSAKETRGT